MESPDSMRRTALLLLVLFLSLAAGIGVTGYRFSHASRMAAVSQAQAQLATIADMKVNQLAAWRGERMGNARVAMVNASSRPDIRLVLEGSADATTKEKTLAWLSSICRNYHYSTATLVDVHGMVRLSTGERLGTAKHYADLARLAIEVGDVVFRDLHEDTGVTRRHLGLLAPLRAGDSATTIGALLLGIDPDAFLYSLIRSWPTPSLTADTILVRREGDEAVYLNELRFGHESALKLRHPLSRTELPAVQAALGREGIVSAEDERGIRVLAAIRQVPDSHWALVAKVDAEEIDAPIRERVALFAAITGALILAAGLAVGFLWRSLRLRFDRQKHEAEMERLALLGHFDRVNRYANDIILLMNEHGRIVEANDRALSTYGYSREELLSMHISALRTPDTRKQFEGQWTKAQQAEGVVFETLHRKKNGTEFPVEVSTRMVPVEGGAFRQSIIRDISERKALEETLRESNEKLAAIIAAAPVGILVLDDERKIRLMNPSAERIFGWTVTELLGKPMPADGNPSGGNWAEVLAGKPLAGSELAHEREDGSSVTLSVSTAPLFGAAGSLQGLMAIVADVTDQRRAEEAIRQRDLLLGAIIGASPVAIHSLDSKGRVTLWNRTAETIFGWKTEEVLGKPFPLVPPDREAEFQTIRERVLTGETITDFESVRVKRDGSRIPISLSEGPLLDGHGSVAGMVGILVDIARRKESEAALLESEAKFRALFNSASDAIYIHDLQFRILEVNEAATRQLGYSRAGLLSMTPLDIDAPEHRDGVTERLNEITRNGRKIFETAHLTKDGETIPVEVSSCLIEYGGAPAVLSIARDATERKRAEESRLRTLDTLNALVHASPVAIAALNRDGIVTMWNRSAEEIFGWSSEEAIGRPLPTVPEGRIHELRSLQETVYQGRSFTGVEMERRRKDGALITVSISGAPLHDDQGRVSGAIALMTDITQRRRAEVLLRESETRFRAAFEQAAVGMCQCDAEGRFLRVNQRFASITGYSPEELYRLNFRHITYPADLPADLQFLDMLMRSEIPTYSIEKRYVRQDGSLVWVNLTVSLTPSPSGDAKELLGVVEDISARKATEIELRENRERLEMALEAANEGLWDWSFPAGITYLSPRYHTMLGYAPGELALTRGAWAEEIHPEDLKRFENAFTDFLLSGRDTHEVQLRMRCKSGDYAWILSRGKVVARNEAGQPVRIVGTNTDITERKRLEDQILHAQKIESVGRLAGGIAHDFNNHLTVINGYCDLLLKRIHAADPVRGPVYEIRRAGERAAAITEQLLAFSRKQVVTPKVLDANEFVKDTESMLRRLIGEDIEVVTLLEENPTPVLIDPGQLQQVLMNLAVNARDAMPVGGKLIIQTSLVDLDETYSQVHEEVTPGPYVLLGVTDTGVGMGPETQAHIFEPFFTTKPKGTGTGLGLSTVYGIVRQSGGWIWVYSEPGRGTTFKVYLPLASGVPEQPRVSVLAAASVRGTETILIVEDQSDVRDLVSEVLKDYGYNVLEAANGEEALSVCRSYSGVIQLMVTDVVMPGMTGRELGVRVLPLRPSLKVLYVSGYTANVIAHQGILDPGMAYLPKPFTPEALAIKVREILGPPPARATVLIVDDDASICQLLSQIVEQGGYETVTAENGKDAMRVLKDHHVELVITDLVMPEQESIETVMQMRRQYPGVRIIAISGAFGGEFLRAVRMLGADATLRKPIHQQELLDTVRRVLAG